MPVQMAGYEGDDYQKQLAARSAVFGPSASAVGGYGDQNTGQYYNDGSEGYVGPKAMSRGVEAPTWSGVGAPKLGSTGAGAMVAPGGGGYGTLGSGGGTGYGTGGSTMSGAYTGGGYELPGSAAASQSLRDLQMGATQGLAGLMSRDTTASRKAIQDALYAGQAEGINSAADRSRQAMLEGTFGRGVGSSSITTELYGRGEQERGDALARALREAFTQAGSEDRADLASEQGLYNASGALATAGLQGEANVALTNAAREQSARQFDQNLQFQGSENAANRAQQSSVLGQQLGLSYAQLGQNANQFASSQTFNSGQNQLNRDAAAQQSQAQMDQALKLLTQQQTFAGGQNDAQRELQKYLATFGGDQNKMAQDAHLQELLLSLANSRDIASNQAVGSGIGAVGSGLGNLLGPALAQLAKGWAS